MLKDGRPMWHHVASLVDEWGEEIDRRRRPVVRRRGRRRDASAAVAEARRLMPRTILLLPGVGAQGGSVADLGRAFQSGPASALVSASRSVIYAFAGRGHRLPRGGGRRGVAAEARGLGRLRLVVRGNDWRRYAAPAAFLLAATIGDRARPLRHGRR